MPPARLAALLVAVSGLSGVVGGVVGARVADSPESTTVVLDRPSDPAPTTAATTGLRSGFDPAAIYARRSPGVVTVYAALPGGETQGSGFVVSSAGTILTNAHVITDVADVGEQDPVRGADAVYVEFRDGERVKAKIAGWDLFNDVGVIRVDPGDHPVVPVPLGDSDRVRVGTPVAAIGSPFGKQTSLAVGVVSATGRTIDSLTSGFSIADAIQVDAPINRGNSGGPLFDARGRVIGITAQIQSASGTAEGVSFVVPIDIAVRALREISERGKVEYAYLGIETQDVTPGVARALGLPATRGALVTAIIPGGPAARAHIESGTSVRRVNGIDVTVGGDIIVGIGAFPVRSSGDIGRVVGRSLRPGQKVAVTVVGQAGRRSVEVTLGTRPGRPT